MRQGNWKALRVTAKGKDSSVSTWQLYDLSTDRTETKDVAKSNPEVVKTLTKQWETWYSDVSNGGIPGKGEKPPKDKSGKKDKKPPAADEES